MLLGPFVLLAALAPQGADPVPAPPADAPRAAEASSIDREEPPDLGRVVQSDGGLVVIDAGKDHGVEVGARVELLVDRSVDLGLGQVASKLDRVATGEVTAVGPSRAQVRLDIDQSAPVGAVVRFTKAARPTLADSPRPGGVWQLRVAVRPFIAIGSTSFGDLSELVVGRRFEDPVNLQLVLEPLGIAAPREGESAIAVFAASAIVSWDLRPFEVGLGLGVSTINNATTGGTGRSARDFGPGIAQLVRLGTVEGVNVTARGLVVIDDADNFAFGSFRADFQAPVSASSWLVLTGGGGIAQYILLEAGLRVLVRGNGTQGSLFLTPLLGYAGVQADHEQVRTVRAVDATGLSIGLAAEWRL